MDWLVAVFVLLSLLPSDSTLTPSTQCNGIIPFEASMIVDEAAVRQLVERGLVDSAEYWASLLVSEKQLSHEQQLSRLSLYADVLFKNRKYKQAIVAVCGEPSCLAFLRARPLSMSNPSQTIQNK